MKLTTALLVIMQALVITQAKSGGLRPQSHRNLSATEKHIKIDTYTKKAGMCIKGYNTAKYDNLSTDECKSKCDADYRCKSFDSRDRGGYNCAIQHVEASIATPLSDCTSSGWSYYERLPLPVEKYNKKEGMCINGYNTAEYDNLSTDECKSMCDVDFTCKSFDSRDRDGYNCAIQRVAASIATPLEDCTSNGWSYYEKNYD